MEIQFSMQKGPGYMESDTLGSMGCKGESLKKKWQNCFVLRDNAFI
jgi:hypothetical protein